MSDVANAPGSHDGDDGEDRLLAELRALGRLVDPVPQEAVAAARSAIAWRSMDRELAELVDESSEASLAGARSTETPTLLSFESPTMVVEVEVRPTAAGRSMLGQLVPTQVARVEVRHQGGTIVVTSDEAGRFTAGPMAQGPVSVRCTSGTHVVETDWFLT